MNLRKILTIFVVATLGFSLAQPDSDNPAKRAAWWVATYADATMPASCVPDHWSGGQSPEAQAVVAEMDEMYGCFIISGPEELAKVQVDVAFSAYEDYIPFTPWQFKTFDDGEPFIARGWYSASTDEQVGVMLILIPGTRNYHAIVF